MARINKTFRPTEEIATALQKKAQKEKVSESEIVNKALRCYLGIGLEIKCDTANQIINKLEKRIENLVKLNNLVEST